MAYQQLAVMYIKYIQIYRKLEECYDQVCCFEWLLEFIFMPRGGFAYYHSCYVHYGLEHLGKFCSSFILKLIDESIVCGLTNKGCHCCFFFRYFHSFLNNFFQNFLGWLLLSDVLKFRG